MTIIDYIVNLLKLLSQLNLEISTLHCCVMNGGCVSYFIIVYMVLSGKAICLFVCFKFRLTSGKHSICSEVLLCST